MKFKLISLLAVILLGAAAVFACFDSDPNSLLGNDSTTVTGGGGSAVDISYTKDSWDSQGWLAQFLGWKDFVEKLTVIKPEAVIRASFPFTLNLSFSGFINDDGTQDTGKITRLALYYYSKSGEWMVLQDIQNPQYSIVSDAESTRALFGRHTVASPLGYAEGEYIPVVFYFKTMTHESFNLTDFLTYRKYLGAPNFAEGANVLALMVKDNRNPY